jgi:hypothetical protein
VYAHMYILSRLATGLYRRGENGAAADKFVTTS